MFGLKNFPIGFIESSRNKNHLESLPCGVPLQTFLYLARGHGANYGYIYSFAQAEFNLFNDIAAGRMPPIEQEFSVSPRFHAKIEVSAANAYAIFLDGAHGYKFKVDIPESREQGKLCLQHFLTKEYVTVCDFVIQICGMSVSSAISFAV
jgi:hypothetical protein